MTGCRSEFAGWKSTLSMSKIKVKISETKYRSFYKILIVSHCDLIITCRVKFWNILSFLPPYFIGVNWNKQNLQTKKREVGRRYSKIEKLHGKDKRNLRPESKYINNRENEATQFFGLRRKADNWRLKKFLSLLK